MAYTTLPTQSAGQTASASGWANIVKADIESMGPHLIVRKTADESNATTTFGADDHLVTPSIAANEVWMLRWWLRCVVTTSDPKFRLTFPSGQISAKINGITGDRNMSGTASPGDVAVPVWNNAPAGFPGVIEAVFSNGSTPGAVVLEWACNGSGTTTVKENSTLWAVKLA